MDELLREFIIWMQERGIEICTDGPDTYGPEFHPIDDEYYSDLPALFLMEENFGFNSKHPEGWSL